MKPSSAAGVALAASPPQVFPPQALPHGSMQPAAGRILSSRAASSLQAPPQMRAVCRSPNLHAAQSNDQIDSPCLNESPSGSCRARLRPPWRACVATLAVARQTPGSDKSRAYCPGVDLSWCSPLGGELFTWQVFHKSCEQAFACCAAQAGSEVSKLQIVTAS